MNLAQLYANVNAKTSYTRPDEIYAALEEAGFKVYAATLKEFGGFFLKFDTTTIALTPGKQQYACPPDLGNLVHLAERISGTQNWHVIEPTTTGHAIDRQQQSVGWSYDDYESGSQFRFYGPFLPEQATQGTQIQQLLFSPAIDQVRQCEIAYTAKWLPIINAASINTLPTEGTYAQQSFAIAEIHRANNDTLADVYETKGMRQLSDYLTWVRNRQTVKWPTIHPYLG